MRARDGDASAAGGVSRAPERAADWAEVHPAMSMPVINTNVSNEGFIFEFELYPVRGRERLGFVESRLARCLNGSKHRAQNEPRQIAAALRGKVHCGVCKFRIGNSIPKIIIAPLVLVGVGSQNAPIIVVCPARIIEIISNIAVDALADEDRFIDDHNRRRG